jgi:GrpB-like predicted nucleotidyltransferase (UPF0157 family)
VVASSSAVCRARAAARGARTAGRGHRARRQHGLPGLAAKPVLDILVGAAPFPLLDDALAALAPLGYEYRGDSVPGRQFFRTNPRTRHLHVVAFGGEEWERLVLFRDDCRAHPEVAAEYEALKRRLATDHSGERARYTEGKNAFIQAVLRRARAERA